MSRPDMKKLPKNISALVRTVHENYEDSTNVLNCSQRVRTKALKGQPISLKVREQIANALNALEEIEVPAEFLAALAKEREEKDNAPKSAKSKGKSKRRPKVSKKTKDETPAPAPEESAPEAEGNDEAPSAPLLQIALKIPSDRCADLLVLLRDAGFDAPSIRLG